MLIKVTPVPIIQPIDKPQRLNTAEIGIKIAKATKLKIPRITKHFFSGLNFFILNVSPRLRFQQYHLYTSHQFHLELKDEDIF